MKLYQTAQRIAAEGEAELEKILESGELDQKIEEEMKKSFTGSQGSSVSIPIRSPSGS